VSLVRVESVVGFPDFPVFVASGSIDARGGAQLIDCKSHRTGANVAVDFGVLVVDVDLFDLIEKLLLLNLKRSVLGSISCKCDTIVVVFLVELHKLGFNSVKLILD